MASLEPADSHRHADSETCRRQARPKRHRAEAQARAQQLGPVIRELQQRGLSMRGIAAELRKRKVETPRGGTWHPHLVARIVQRLEGVQA